MITTYFMFILSGFFMAAAVPKLFSSAEFMKTLYGIGVPRFYRRFAAAAIPVSEAVGVILLLIPVTRTIGGISLLVLLFSFSVITVKAIAQKKKIDCNCFGRIMPSELGWKGLIRLTVLIVMTICVLTGSDVNPYDRPAEELFYQIVSSIGIIALYAIISMLVNNWISIRKGEV